MKDVRPLLDRVLSEAIALVRQQAIPVYTFAFYHDHESRAIGVCIDTEESSQRLVKSSNEYNLKYFWPKIISGDLKGAALWNANAGRSLSLGDFTLVNIARTDLPSGKITDAFYLEMMKSLRAKEEEVIRLAASSDRLLFCCSGADDEVAFTWSASTLRSSHE